MDEPTVRAGLARLQAAEFLYEVQLFPEAEYTFKHALTHEVTYGTLLRERQRTLHARLVEAIEQVYRERLDEHFERLAHHAQQGGVWGKAVKYAQQVAARAVGRSAFSAAETLFEAALAAVSHLPQSRETQTLSVDLMLALRGVCLALGEQDRSLDLAQRTLRLAEVLGDGERLTNAKAHLVSARYLTGDSAGAAELGEQVLAIVEAKGQRAQLRHVRTFLGQTYIALGDYRRAIVFLERNREALGEGVASDVLARSLISNAFLSVGLAELGQFRQAVAIAQEGARLVKTSGIGGAYERLHVLWGLTVPACLQGDHNRAIPVLEEGLALARDLNLLIYLPAFAAFLGNTYAHAGRLPEGLQLLEEGIVHSESTCRVSRGLFRALQSEALLVAGRVDDARSTALGGLEGARARGERGDEALCLRALGEAAASGNPPDAAAARAHLEEALTLAGELEMRPLIAHCHLGLGKLYRHSGKREKAQEQLTTATTMYRDMEMTYWLEQAEANMMELK